MGYLRGSQDWDGDGKYDFFDRAMDVKNMELLQEQNKKVDEYQRRLKEENRRSTPPVENNSETEIGAAGIILSLIFAIAGAVLVFTWVTSSVDKNSASGFLAFVIAVFAFLGFLGIGITFVEYMNRM